jgi:CBS domain-containing protein
MISVVADALVRRMIALAIEAEGPPPAEFTWISLGSHGRREAVPSSDVDSGLAWREGPDERETASYMHRIAEQVADGLRDLGWRLDPHGVTASGSFSASSIEEWRHAIGYWLSKPSDERALIATSILLDGRVIQGPAALDPRRILLELGGGETLLDWMLEQALVHRPPTGFLRNRVVERSGRHRRAFDIKHGALLPIVNLARYAAMRAGSQALSTVERLRDAGSRGALTAAEARTLEEAYELFAELRLDHQVSRLEEDLEPDDQIDPHQLNPLTRRYLRDAFREVAAVQKSLSAKPRGR